MGVVWWGIEAVGLAHDQTHERGSFGAEMGLRGVVRVLVVVLVVNLRAGRAQLAGKRMEMGVVVPAKFLLYCS